MVSKPPKGAKATTGDVAESLTAGRRFTKRLLMRHSANVEPEDLKRRAADLGLGRFDPTNPADLERLDRASGLTRLDSADYFDLQRAKAEAAAVLVEAGYDTATLYDEHGACFALERVRADRHDDDSPAGLAAQALQQCRQLETYLEAYPVEPIAQAWMSVVDYAYRIGRCLAFAKAYSIDGAAQAARRKGKPGSSDDYDDARRNDSIRRAYAAAKGERGTIKQLALQHDLSVRTISRIVRDMRT